MIPDYLSETDIIRAIQEKGIMLGRKEKPTYENVKAALNNLNLMHQQGLIKVFCDGKCNGFVFGVIMPYHLDIGFNYATLLVSWFTEDMRGIYSMRLIKRFFNWAKENKADGIMLDDCLCTPEVGRVYEKWGMKRMETHYYKIFEGDK